MTPEPATKPKNTGSVLIENRLVGVFSNDPYGFWVDFRSSTLMLWFFSPAIARMYLISLFDAREDTPMRITLVGSDERSSTFDITWVDELSLQALYDSNTQTQQLRVFLSVKFEKP